MIITIEEVEEVESARAVQPPKRYLINATGIANEEDLAVLKRVQEALSIKVKA